MLFHKVYLGIVNDERISSQLEIEDNQFSQKEMVQQLKCRISSFTNGCLMFFGG